MATEKFHWTAEDGTEIIIPKMGSLPGRDLRTTRQLSMEDRAWTLLERAVSPEQLEQIDSLPAGELSRFMDAWGDTLGE